MTKAEKENLDKIQVLSEIMDLIKSGYAGVDKNGTIKDRRTTQGLIACRKNQTLSTPEPLPVEGGVQRG